MPPAGWTTPEQNAWLQPWVPRFKAAQASQSPSVFLPGFYREWFARFPERDMENTNLTEEETKAAGQALEARRKASRHFVDHRLCLINFK
jgi:hypothetical protein